MSNSTLKQFIDGSWVSVIAGSPGPGIATGGTAGQVLIKSGPAEYATEWGDFDAVVTDLTPQLGGDLDLNSSNITGTGNINITGSLTTSGLAYPTVDGTSGQVLTTDGAGALSFATVPPSGIANVIQDLTPQLGGDLDLNGNTITQAGSTANLRFISDIGVFEGNSGTNQILLGDANRTGIYGPTVIIAGNSVGGTGTISLNGIEYPVADGTSGQVLTTDGLGALSFTTVAAGGITNVIEDTTPQLGGDLDLNSRFITQAGSTANMRIIGNNLLLVSGSNNLFLSDSALTVTAPTVTIAGLNIALGSVLSTSNVTFNGIKFPAAGTASTGQVLTAINATTMAFTTPAASIANVVEDLTPQLGGQLDGQGNIVSDVTLQGYKETIHSLGTTDTPAIDVANGNIQSVTITAGLALPLFTNPEVGQSVTLTVSGSGTATGAAGYLFAGGAVTLTTNSIVTIFYDGTNYWTNISTDFQ